MLTVLHLCRSLEQRPELPEIPGVGLRHFAGTEDVPLWLELRHRAFARERIGVRQWDENDFRREFLEKSWWSPEHLWFAEVPSGLLSQSRQAVGTIALAERGAGSEARPVVHWLSVLPRWRRHGVGRLLLAALEQACWDWGHRAIWLETHVGWQAAVEFYQAQGYRPVE